MEGKYIGFDVSKQTFNVSFLGKNNKFTDKVFTFSDSDMEKMLENIGKEDICVMEATGVYYLRLAYFLTENGRKVSVVNPLIIRNYVRMKMKRTKTDKADARLISQYGESEKPELWERKELGILKIKNIYSIIESLQKELTVWKNKKEAAVQDKNFGKQEMNEINELIEYHSNKINKLEKELEKHVKAEYPEEEKILKSISGIGPKTTAVLIAITNAFRNFENCRELISYVGLAPRIYDSGTSVKGKAHICKLGMSDIRKLLYMCSISASKCNKYCKDLYDRLIAKGKPTKVALIAVANKLLRIAFGCIKNKTIFNTDLVLNKVEMI